MYTPFVWELPWHMTLGRITYDKNIAEQWYMRYFRWFVSFNIVDIDIAIEWSIRPRMIWDSIFDIGR